MRTQSLLLLFLSLAIIGTAQVSFCPKGAVWNSAFVLIPAWNGKYVYLNEQVVYAQDTLLNGDTVKELRHRFYYATCYNSNFTTVKKTYIKQKGDTVFFRNAKTLNTWQILYNYAVPAGGSWSTTIINAAGNPITYFRVVDSVKTITLNGMPLRRQYLTYGMVTERIGGSGFLFDFQSQAPGCDGYYFAETLCYRDDTFGTLSFSDKGCNFSGTIDINGLPETTTTQHIRLVPNPAKDRLSIQRTKPQAIEVNIIDLSGRIVASFHLAENKSEIALTTLSPGLYTAQVICEERSQFLKLLME